MSHASLNSPGILSSLEKFSFSDDAAQLVRDKYPELQTNYQKTIVGVWDAILSNNAFGMIPFENSSGGVVWPHLERLMQEDQALQIASAVRLKVEMCAGGRTGTTLENVIAVHSHAKGLEQTTKFIARLPKNIRTIQSDNTSEATTKVADLEIGNIALASRRAIQAAGLEVLAENISDLQGSKNVTKFFVVHKNGEQKLPDVKRDFHAAISTPMESRGVLAAMLNQIASCNLNLVSIHSRSIDDHEYAFFIEMDKCGTDKEMSALDQWLHASSAIKSVKWLGSWDENLRNSMDIK